MTVLQSGEVIVSGAFTTAGGVAVNHVARYDPSTNMWSAMGSGVYGTEFGIKAAVELPGGDIIVGGSLYQVDGVHVNRIARYNTTSSTWSAFGPGMNNTIRAMCMLADGDIIAGGDFNSVGSVTARKIARYHSDTNTWSPLGSGIGTDDFDKVNALAVLQNGDVLVGGYFTIAGGIEVSHLARYNPTSDTWSNPGSGTSSVIFSFTPLLNGNIIVSGNFRTAGGVSTRLRDI
ncbi:MAG: hypothetical protein IPK69_11990 [Phycisphaerales bacterium]|nr:MAG: hypothetical protein IPK69_11990 [Phycisphaerales bacterium]